MWEKVISGEFPKPETYKLRAESGWIYFMLLHHREPCAVFVPDPPNYQQGN